MSVQKLSPYLLFFMLILLGLASTLAVPGQYLAGDGIELSTNRSLNDTINVVNCSEGDIILKNSSILWACTDFNSSIDARFSSNFETIVPFNITNVTGVVDSGNVTSVQVFNDGLQYNLSEVTGTPGFDIFVNFTNVTMFNQIEIYELYDGSVGHIVDVNLWNFNSSTWDSFGQIVDQTSFNLSIYVVADDENYINNSDVWLQLDHTSPGNVNHDLSIDFIALVEGAIGSITSHSALSNLGNDDHTQYVLVDGTRNITATISVQGKLFAADWTNVSITESQISDLVHTTDTNASTACTGSTTYLDGENNCDDLSDYLNSTGDSMSGDLNMLSNEIKGSDLNIEWTNLSNYPSDCANGEWVQGVEDSLVCSNASSSIDDLWVNVSGDNMDGALTIGGGFVSGGIRLEPNGNGWFGGSIFVTDNITVGDIVNANITGDLNPSVNESFDVGNLTYTWKSMTAQNLTATDDLTVNDDVQIGGDVTIANGQFDTRSTSSIPVKISRLNNNILSGLLTYFQKYAEGTSTLQPYAEILVRPGTNNSLGTQDGEFAIRVYKDGVVTEAMNINEDNNMNVIGNLLVNGDSGREGTFHVEADSGGESVYVEFPSSDQSKIFFQEASTDIFSIFYDGTGSGDTNLLKVRSELSGSQSDLITIGGDGKIGFNTSNLVNSFIFQAGTPDSEHYNAPMKITSSGAMYIGPTQADNTFYMMGNVSTSAAWDVVVGMAGGTSGTGRFIIQTGRTSVADRIIVNNTGNTEIKGKVVLSTQSNDNLVIDGGTLAEIIYTSGTSGNDWSVGTGWSGSGGGTDSRYWYNEAERMYIDGDGNLTVTEEIISEKYNYESTQTSYASIGPADCIPRQPDVDDVFITDTIFTVQTGAEVMSCSVNLPDGVTVTLVQCWGTDTSNVWTFRRKTLSSTSTGTMASATMDSSDSSISNAVVDNENYSYGLTSTMGASDSFHGCKIRYTYTKEGR